MVILSRYENDVQTKLGKVGLKWMNASRSRLMFVKMP
jgi:hypothetical protein